MSTSSHRPNAYGTIKQKDDEKRHAMDIEKNKNREQLWNANYLKVWTANILMYMAFYIVMPLLPLYLNDTFGADKQTTGIVLCGYTITALMIRPFSGYLVDSFSRKKLLLLFYGMFAAMFMGYLVCSSLFLFIIIRTLHGIPFGATTVAGSTVMIDVLPSQRRAEGIGYYGLSNNLAMAAGPSIGLYLYSTFHDFHFLFALSLIIGCIGFVVDCTLHVEDKPIKTVKQPISLDRFFLMDSIPESVVIVALSFSFGVISTYLAIYSREVVHITSGTGTWFALLALGLMTSRIIGSRSLRRGQIVGNASFGMTLSAFGYFLFVACPNQIGYYGAALIVGLGNGHMYPAMQNIFIGLAPNSRRGTANSSLLTSWDTGVGLGIILGGAVSELLSYTAAFAMAFGVNLVGVVFFWAYVRGHYIRNKVQ